MGVRWSNGSCRPEVATNLETPHHNSNINVSSFFPHIYFFLVSNFLARRKKDEEGFSFKMDVSWDFSCHLSHHFSAIRCRSGSFSIFYFQIFVLSDWSGVIWLLCLVKTTLIGRLESLEETSSSGLYSGFAGLKLFACLFCWCYFLVDLMVYGVVLFPLSSIPRFPLQPPCHLESEFISILLDYYFFFLICLCFLLFFPPFTVDIMRLGCV